MGNISNLTSTMKRLKLLKGWLEEKEEYFCIDRFDTFDFMSALTTAIWVIEDEIAKKELDDIATIMRDENYEPASDVFRMGFDEDDVSNSYGFDSKYFESELKSIVSKLV